MTTIKLAVGSIVSPDTWISTGMPRYATFPKAKHMNNVRNICLFRRKIIPVKIARRQLLNINSELETMSGVSVRNEKEVLIRAEKINTGKPIFRANSFNTVDQSSPMFLKRCNSALAKIIRNSGAITTNICSMVF